MMDGVPSEVNVLLRKVSYPGLMFFLRRMSYPGLMFLLFFLWIVSNPGQFPDCSWKVSNPESRHQKLQEDWMGTLTGYQHKFMSINSICRYSSTWCCREKSWSRHEKLQEEEGTSIISMSLYLDS